MPKTHIPSWARSLLAVSLLAYPSLSFAASHGGSAGLADFITDFILNQFMFAMGGIVLGFVFYYAVRLIIESQDENVITKTRKSFIYALMGFAAIAAMVPIQNAFVSGTPIAPINVFPIIWEFNSLIQFLIIMSQGIFVLLITFYGLRMLASQGEEADVERARKGIINCIVGVVILGLADVIVSAVAGNSPAEIGFELAGVAGFLITLIGAASVLALIIAGVLLIVSTDESLKERAKKIVSSAIVAIIIAIGSYAIILTFI